MLRPLLGKHLRAIAPDLPGHGRSPPPPFAGERGYDWTLDTLTALIERLPAPVQLAGYSQGARLALALALRTPQQIRGMILESGSPGLADPAERTARRQADDALADTIEQEGLQAFLDRWEALPLFAGMQRLPPEEHVALRRRREANTASGLAAALRAFGTGVQPSYWDDLPRLALPVLLMTGAEDGKFTAIAREMVRLLPRATHRALAGCGHAPHLEAPEEYARVVLDWISGVERLSQENDESR